MNEKIGVHQPSKAGSITAAYCDWISKRDDEAAELIFSRYFQVLVGRLCSKFRFQDADAESVSANALTEFFLDAANGKHKSLHLHRQEIAKYLFVRADDRARDLLRSRMRLEKKIGMRYHLDSVIDELAGEGALDGEINGEVAAKFCDNLTVYFESLSEKEREVVRLRLEDFTYREIAEEMGIAVATANRQYWSAVAKLRELLMEDLKDD